MDAAMVDADPQGSLIGLGKLQNLEGLDLIAIDDLEKVQSRYDIAIIETLPYLSNLPPEFFKMVAFSFVGQ